MAITNELPTSGNLIEDAEELQDVGLPPQFIIDDASTGDSDFWDEFRTLTFDVSDSDNSEERNPKK